MDDNGDEVTIRPGINGSSAQIELQTRLLKMLEKPQPHLVPVQERNCPLALKCSTVTYGHFKNSVTKLKASFLCRSQQAMLISTNLL